MCKIKIEKIGPLKKVDIEELEKVTVVIGPQSSGKSTLAKLICFCQWVEKRCYINFDEESRRFMSDKVFVETLSDYHRMEGYITKDSKMLYNGNYVDIELKGEEVIISKTESGNQYLYPKICYIPAERNIVSAIPNITKYNDKKDSMLYFMYDWVDAKGYLKDVDLSTILEKEIRYHYDVKNGEDFILDNGKSIKLSSASSGVQSLVPLYMVLITVLDSVYVRYKPLSPDQRQKLKDAAILALSLNEKLEILKEKKTLSKSQLDELLRETQDAQQNELFMSILQEQQESRDMLDSFERKFFYMNTHLYIEEPEQNIFPNTQAKFLYWLLQKLQHPERNHTAFITTHSPYILFALNNCLIGKLVDSKITDASVRNQLKSLYAWIDPKKVAVYELHDGEIKSIQDEDNLLLNNYLNKTHQQLTSEYLTMLSYYEPRK